MKNLKVFGLIVLIAVIAGAYFYPRANSFLGAVAPAGTTAAQKGWVSVDFALSTGSSTSVLNTDSFDRYVTDTVAYCQGLGTMLTNTGAGVANLTLQVATTTSSAQGLQGSTQYVANVTIATTTNNGTTFVSTTTAPVNGDYGRLWPTGTYLTYQFNATSTNAFCTVGSSYVR